MVLEKKNIIIESNNIDNRLSNTLFSAHSLLLYETEVGPTKYVGPILYLVGPFLKWQGFTWIWPNNRVC